MRDPESEAMQTWPPAQRVRRAAEGDIVYQDIGGDDGTGLHNVLVEGIAPW
jgi:hypothetical protein